jgi:hypothetical protein
MFSSCYKYHIRRQRGGGAGRGEFRGDDGRPAVVARLMTVPADRGQRQEKNDR